MPAHTPLGGPCPRSPAPVSTPHDAHHPHQTLAPTPRPCTTPELTLASLSAWVRCPSPRSTWAAVPRRPSFSAKRPRRKRRMPRSQPRTSIPSR